MVKHSTNRKRSYKKRRMIRKLKKTMRRNIHMVGGGGDDEIIIKLILQVAPGILKLVLGNIEPFVRICVLLLSMSQPIRGGRSSKSRKLYQTGGVSQRIQEELTEKLTNMKEYFTKQNKIEVVGCIDKIQNKVNAQLITTENSQVPSTSSIESELTPPELTSQLPATETTPSTESNNNILEKFKEFKRVIFDNFENFKQFKTVIIEKVKTKIEDKVLKLQSILNSEEYKCLIIIKNAVFDDFIQKINSSVTEYVNK